jgi:hypothetical protein
MVKYEIDIPDELMVKMLQESIRAAFETCDKNFAAKMKPNHLVDLIDVLHYVDAANAVIGWFGGHKVDIPQEFGRHK